MVLSQLQTCLTKKRYYFFDDALSALRIIKKYGKRNTLFIYQCEICRFYHLTKHRELRGKDNVKDLDLKLKIKKALTKRE